MPCRTTALAAALSLLPLGQPLFLGTLGITAATTAVVLHQGAAIAQDASAVARIAKAITVRLEGATQGSGVIVKREGDRYTVLTAWHVIEDVAQNEKITIIFPDSTQIDFAREEFQRVCAVPEMQSIGRGGDDYPEGIDLAFLEVPQAINYYKSDFVKPLLSNHSPWKGKKDSRWRSEIFISGYPSTSLDLAPEGYPPSSVIRLKKVYL